MLHVLSYLSKRNYLSWQINPKLCSIVSIWKNIKHCLDVSSMCLSVYMLTSPIWFACLFRTPQNSLIQMFCELSVSVYRCIFINEVEIMPSSVKRLSSFSFKYSKSSSRYVKTVASSVCSRVWSYWLYIYGWLEKAI